MKGVFFFFLQMFNIIMQLLAAAEHTMTGKNTQRTVKLTHITSTTESSHTHHSEHIFFNRNAVFIL